MGACSRYSGCVLNGIKYRYGHYISGGTGHGKVMGWNMWGRSGGRITMVEAVRGCEMLWEAAEKHLTSTYRFSLKYGHFVEVTLSSVTLIQKYSCALSPLIARSFLLQVLYSSSSNGTCSAAFQKPSPPKAKAILHPPAPRPSPPHPSSHPGPSRPPSPSHCPHPCTAPCTASPPASPPPFQYRVGG